MNTLKHAPEPLAREKHPGALDRRSFPVAIMFTDMVGRRTPRRRDEALTLASVPQGRSRIAQRFIRLLFEGVDFTRRLTPSGA